MEMMLQTQNLCKYFRKQKAVNNVSLNIEKGQIYGLLGPNGAGKSTTLKMLTGMMKPTAGKIYFDGKLSCSGFHHTGQHFQCGRFTSAIRSKQSINLSLFDIK